VNPAILYELSLYPSGDIVRRRHVTFSSKIILIFAKTLKINGEALSDESVLKSNGNKSVKRRYFLRINGDEAFNAE
jgi:hypothetical protein